jgi:hemerythrin
MALITWSNRLSVGVKEIDAQHHHLVGLINDLHDAMKSGKSKEVLGPTLQALTDYTVYHFGTEEQMFKDTGYPARLSHQAEHRALTQQVLEIKRKFEAGQPVITIDLMEFLRDWLSDHIKGVDKRYTSFFHSKGIQ